MTSGLKRRKIKRDLKAQGLSEQEIARNLYYLVQTGWIAQNVKTFPLQRGSKTIYVDSISYKITDKGINDFEGHSRFQKVPRLNGIKLEKIRGIVVIGDHNVIYNKHSRLFKSLDLMGEEIRFSDKLSDEQKLSCQAEIDTITSQLSKAIPDRNIIRRAWNALKAIVTIGGVVNILEKVRPLIEQLLSP